MLLVRFSDLSVEDYLWSTFVPGSTARTMYSGTETERQASLFYFNVNMAASLGSVIGTAINIGGYRAMGGLAGFGYNVKVKSVPVMMMGLFAQKNIEALVTGDLTQAPQVRMVDGLVSPYIQSQLRSSAARDTRGGKERGLFYN